ncbi:MAG TPA: ATP-binding protein [Azospirillaceae bacterium]|nr:ATP-binding protein [Azospirillaceae bacterium]
MLWRVGRRSQGAAGNANGRSLQQRAMEAAPGAWCLIGHDRTIQPGPGFDELVGAAPRDRDALSSTLDDTAFALDAALATGVPRAFVVRTRDGRSFQANLSPDPDGAILWLVPRAGPAGLDAPALRAALDELPYPVWLRDLQGCLIWVNAAYTEAVDADHPEGVVDSQVELDPRFGRALALEALAEATPRSRRSHVVIAGERRLIEAFEVPVAGAGAAALAGHALDLTDHEGLQAELGRHITGHAQVLERLGSAIVIYGPDTRLRFFNQAYVRLSGLDEGWLSTEPNFGDVLEELRNRRRLPEAANFPRYKREMLSLFTSLIEPREDLLHLPDDTTQRQLVVPHPFGGLMFIMEDVTDRLQLESSYNTLMAVQRETLDNLSEGIAVFGGDGRLRLSNPAFRSIWALGETDMAGQPHLSEVVQKLRGFFADNAGWAAFARDIAAMAFGRDQASGRVERKDGSIVQYTTVPLPDGAVIASFLDISDTVRVEQALRESNRALALADRLKSEFIANVSYQLRTPLNAIMGFAELLQNRYFGHLNEKQAEYVSAMLDSGKHLLLLVDDILDLATIEAGFMKLERVPTDVRALLASVVDLTRSWAEKERLSISLDVPADIGTAEIDDKRIKQALFNLVSNSVKFTPAGGRIVLSATRDGDELVLSVSDTGVGIAARDHERVFGRFERASTSQRQTGVGLGLTLAKNFVEMHGGRVRLNSQPSQGTRVDCILPVASRDA